MVGKIKKWVLTFALIIYGVNSYAQNVIGQSNTPDIQQEAAKYEQYYEVILDNALSDYYKEGTFIVDVKVTLEKILVATGYEVIEGEEPIKIENLPGLPFIPPNLRSSTQPKRDSLKASGFNTNFKINRLFIKVLVDTSYSNEDLDFVEEAATLISNADKFRGDVVSVDKKVFPRSTRGIEQDAILKDATQTEKESEPISPLFQEPDKKMFLGIDWNNPQHLLYIISFLGLLFLIVLIYALVKKPKSEENSVNPYTMFDPNLVNTTTNSVSKEDVGPDSKTLAAFEEDKTYLTNTCISNPKIVADLIQQWIASDDEQGIIRSVRSFSSVDEKLLNVLENYLSAETYGTIRFGIANTDPIPLLERIEEARSFRRSVQQIKTSKKTPDSGSNLFDFIYQLTDQQLLHLMKEESDEMVSILLAQIAGERAGLILQKLDEQKRISILLKMGKINNIPISVYKKVAAHFSNKALSISDMKYVAADGVDTILTTIETLPLSEQDSYVRSIAEQDLALAKKIRKFFIGFDDLPKVKDEFVQSAIEEIPTEIVILALRTAPATVREKILKVRPKREQQLILSEIDNSSDAPAREIEEAQKTILYAVRRKMKTEG